MKPKDATHDTPCDTTYGGNRVRDVVSFLGDPHLFFSPPGYTSQEWNCRQVKLYIPESEETVAVCQLPEEGEGYPMTSFSDYVRSWFAFKETTWCRKVASRNREYMLPGWLKVLGPLPIGEVTTIHVQGLYMSRRMSERAKRNKEGTRSNTWMNTERGTLRSFFIWAVAAKLIETSPISGWPRLQPEEPPPKEAVPEENEDLICEELRDHPACLAFVRLACRTSLRYGSIENARCGWLKNGILTVPAGFYKQRRTFRIPVPAKAREHLNKSIDPEAPLIPGLPDNTTLNRTIRAAAARAGVPAPKMNCTCLRATAFDRVLHLGVPGPNAAKLLGWETTGVAYKHYLASGSDAENLSILEQI